MDIDSDALDRFKERILSEGLSDRVSALSMSLFELSFEDESFDIIWSEGSIYPIGFERGLQELRNLLKSGGCLVIMMRLKAKRTELK